MFNDRSDHGSFFSNSDNAVYSEKDSDFRKIYNAVMQTLFRISYRIVNDEEAAEDLVHDSLIKMREKKLVFPSLDDAKFWLIGKLIKNISRKKF